MQATPRRDTPAELALRSALHRRGLRFRVDRAPLADRRRRADVVFPTERVAIFVDGCFWHGCPTHGTWPKSNKTWWRAKIEANISRDADTNRVLQGAGWSVMRFWEHDDPEDAAAAVAAEVRARQVTNGAMPD